MNRLRKRLVLDALLTALLAFEMFFQLTGDFLHEVVGIVFFTTIVVHLVLSRKWIASTTKAAAEGKKLKKGNALRAAFGIALGITSLVLMASSLAISNQLYLLLGTTLAGTAYSSWVFVHTVSSYLLCGLVAGHLAIHWASVAAAFRIPYNHERRAAINAGVTAVAALGVAAIGLRASDALASAAAAAAQSTADSSTSPTSGNTMQGATDLGAPSNQSSPTTESKTRNRTRQRGSGAGVSTGSAPGTSSDYGSTGNSGGTSSSSGSDSSGSSSGSDSSGSSNPGMSSSTVTGYCTLCPKHCPLSAPQCNKPYLAGLI